MDTLLAVKGIEKLGFAARREVVELSARQQLNPDHLVTVFSLETAGSFDPAQPNLAGGSARGLIQFMPETAVALGTTSAELVKMTQVEQLGYVEKYYAPAKGNISSLSDHYLAVFAPVGIGQGPDFVLYSSPSPNYFENAKAFDKDNKGFITVADATGTLHGIAQAAALRPRVAVDAPVDAPAPVDEPPRGGVDGVIVDAIGEAGLALLGMGLFILALSRWKRQTRTAARM